MAQPSAAEVRCFFVGGEGSSGRSAFPLSLGSYGTLRPDDNISHSTWTQPFNEGLQGERAELTGASMYYDKWPVVVLENSTRVVQGIVLRCIDPSRFDAKLREADEIEEYPSYYNRSAVMVRRLRDGGEEKAWVYHRQSPDKSIPIEGGDWVEWLRNHPERHPRAAALHYAANHL